MNTVQITLTVRLSTSALDSRRGVVRMHPEVLDALGLRQWDAVALIGARATVALAAAGEATGPPGTVTVDDITLSNCGLVEGAELTVSPVHVEAAQSVELAGSTLASGTVSPETLHLALTGKVLSTGDAVSLLPQDLAPGADPGAVRRRLSAAIGMTWTNELLTVTATVPDGAVTVAPTTRVCWRVGSRATPVPGGAAPWATARAHPPAPAHTAPPVPMADLIGAQSAAATLSEWLELAFRRPELLRRLGASTRLGAAVHGPAGVGKATLVRAVCASVRADLVELSGPSVAALEVGAAADRVRGAIADATARASGGTHCVLLLTDVDFLLPATEPPPLATVVLDELRAALALPGLALVVTTAHPESVDPRLRDPDLVDREVAVPPPDARTRGELLGVLLRGVPLADDVAPADLGERTPGFVAADLVALRREAAVRAALRHSAADADSLTVAQQDLIGALDVVRPTSMSTSDQVTTGGLTLDDVGDMVETKQALSEAVLWPLRYPDSFARLGVDPPRGVLLYGPPGCGKTFVVRALAGSGALNVFTVKGAELLDKWVGESERAVRQLFARASAAAPSLVFLDEIDALAPRRGGSSDAGVSDRVVAALLTELDGVEPLRDVVVLGATNRPELIDPALLRPGRLERMVYVPPPDSKARLEILTSASKRTPLASDVDLGAIAEQLEGYSAADCAAVIRESALGAMRESLDAAEVTRAHVDAARKAVRPSLDPVQVAQLAEFANARKD